jgi:hypothetical protein
MWNLETGQCDGVFAGHVGPVFALEVSPFVLYSVARDGTLVRFVCSVFIPLLLLLLLLLLRLRPCYHLSLSLSCFFFFFPSHVLIPSVVEIIAMLSQIAREMDE